MVHTINFRHVLEKKCKYWRCLYKKVDGAGAVDQSINCFIKPFAAWAVGITGLSAYIYYDYHVQLLLIMHSYKITAGTDAGAGALHFG